MFHLFRRRWPQIPFDEIRKRARMLVIDDEDFAYQQLFARDGYTLEKWDDIKQLSELEEGRFDIILLDLQGVGRSESADQGFGVLKHLREHSPAQLLVAYSNADWGLQYQEFFKLADAVLPKSADYVVFKENVDALLRERFSLGFYLARIRREAHAYDVDLDYLEDISRQAILRRNVRGLRRHLARTTVNPNATHLAWKS